MRTLDLARKDLMQIFRQKRSIMFLALMPVVFTLFFGFVFSSQSADDQDSRLKVGVLNLDPQGVLSESFVEMLSASETVSPVALQIDQAADFDKMVREGDVSAGVRIPANYSADLLQGKSPRMEFVLDEMSQNGQTVRRAVQTTLSRLSGSLQAAQDATAAYELEFTFTDGAARQAYLNEALSFALQSWRNPRAVVRLAGPTLAAVEGESAAASNPYTQSSPGMMVMFAVFGLVQTATVLVLERRNGALQRLLTTPLRRAELIGGHLLAMFLVVFGQQFLLVVFGQIILKVDYLREPFAILLVMVSLSLWVASLGMMIGALAKTEDQVTLWSLITMFLFSALGGTWFSLEFAGKAFATAGHFTPTAWAMDGFQNIIVRSLSFQSVLLPVAVLLAYAAAFFGIAVWKFKFE